MDLIARFDVQAPEHPASSPAAGER
jgi:hypothetical protein